MQTVWKGSISFGLVSIPVRLVSATDEKDISMRQVHEADGGRIKYKRVCSIDGEEVPYGSIARGYEMPDGDVVVLNDSDFAGLPISSAKNVEVLSFADASDINPIALSRAYYADPTGDAKPYVLLYDTLVSTNKVAVVKVALRQKERLAVIRPQDGVLVVHTMLWPDEVRETQPGFDRGGVELREQELQMASMYVEAFDSGFHPEQYHDEYRDALQQVVEAKAAGREFVAPPETPTATNVVDLMEALRASVAAATGQAGASDSSTSAVNDVDEATEQAAKKPSAKKAPAKKAPADKKAADKKAAKTPAGSTRRSA